MTESLLERSARYIDGGVYEGPASINPVDSSFHEIADGVGLVCGFSHIWTLDADEGLVVVDTSQPDFASAAVEHLRRWRDLPVDTVVYTHGHADHVSGAPVFRDDAVERGRLSPTVVAHRAVERRLDRYKLTRGYNEIINARQFGRRYRAGFYDADWVRPQVTHSDGMDLEVGGTRMRLIHEKGETDDHTIAWVPQHGVLFTGDLIIWAFPNAGNPQKAQRYPAEWAAALRRMIDLRPSLLAPAHGLPVSGTERIARVLDDTATVLEGLVTDTLAMMNAGAPLDEILHTVRVPDRSPGTAVPAPLLRRARVRGAQHLAPVRRLARRQSGPAQAGTRRRGGRGGGGHGRRGGLTGPAGRRALRGRRTAARLPTGRVGRPGGTGRRGGPRRTGRGVPDPPRQ